MSFGLQSADLVEWRGRWIHRFFRSLGAPWLNAMGNVVGICSHLLSYLPHYYTWLIFLFVSGSLLLSMHRPPTGQKRLAALQRIVLVLLGKRFFYVKMQNENITKNQFSFYFSSGILVTAI